jgi:ACS family hexuronate transporter-like MFS transporter
VWWFYVYWLPKYLADRYGFGLKGIAMVAWIPFVSVDLGNLTGGWFSGHLMQRGWSLDASRKCLLRIGAAGMLAGAPAGISGDAGVSMACIAVATFAYGIWGTMMLTLPADLFHPSEVGVVSGLSGTGAGLGGIAFTWLTGAVVDRTSYRPVFAGAALLPVLALVLVQVLIPQIGSVTAWRKSG